MSEYFEVCTQKNLLRRCVSFQAVICCAVSYIYEEGNASKCIESTARGAFGGRRARRDRFFQPKTQWLIYRKPKHGTKSSTKNITTVVHLQRAMPQSHANVFVLVSDSLLGDYPMFSANKLPSGAVCREYVKVHH